VALVREAQTAVQARAAARRDAAATTAAAAGTGGKEKAE
jgi:hypothetical protein